MTRRNVAQGSIDLKYKSYSKVADMETIECKCGCGQTLLKYHLKWGYERKYICGHQRRGKKHSKETRKKISEAKSGCVVWNKGKKGLQVAWNKGIPCSEETKRKISEAQKGEKNHNWKGGTANNSRDIARKIYQDHHKMTLFREVDVHHIDHDPFNNEISNLQAIWHGDHTKLHYKLNPWC